MKMKFLASSITIIGLLAMAAHAFKAGPGEEAGSTDWSFILIAVMGALVAGVVLVLLGRKFLKKGE
jgi:bacteriorhodopsin